MIKVTHDKINKILWDKRLEQSHFRRGYLYSWYLDIVAPKWEILVSDECYSKAFLLPLKSKYKLSYIMQPFMVQQIGVIGSYDANFISECLKYIKRNYLFYYLYINEQREQAIQNKKIKKRINLVLNTKPDYRTNYAHYNVNTKRNIKKFYKTDNVEIQLVDNEAIMKDIIELDKYQREEFMLKEEQRLILYKTMKEAFKKDSLIVLGAFEDKKIVAGAFFLKCNGVYTFIYSGNSKRGKEIGAMHAITDSFIENTSDCNLLDFEGSINEGVARFYKGFGAKKENYSVIKRFQLIKK